MLEQVRSRIDLDTPTLALSRKWRLRLISVTILITVWEIVSTYGNIPLFAPPSAIVSQMYLQLVVTQVLLDALVQVVIAAFGGYLLATVVGIPLGFLIGFSTRAKHILDPVLDGLYVAPLIALVPLIIIWFGLGLLGKMAFIFTFPFFVIVFNTEAGVTETPEGLVHAAKAYGADPIDVYTRVHLRHSIPYIFTGLRLGAGRAVRGVVVAELFISAANIGRYLMEAGGSFEVDKLFAGVLSLSVLGIIALRTVRIIELSLLDYKR